MAVSKEKMGSILTQFTLLFGMPEAACAGQSVWEDAVGLWTSLMRDFDEGEVMTAARAVALKLKRFPVPADFVEQIEATRNIEALAHG